MERKELITAAQEFFFEGMLHGWPSGVGKVEIPDMPGYKKLEYPLSGDIKGFHLRDVYTRNEDSGKSEGSTKIWHKGRIIWSMHYEGHYEKKALNFLKSALRRAYEGRLFHGGRGPKFFSDQTYPGLVYTNVETWWEFGTFSGYESIVDNENTRVLGSHKYTGGLLI